MIIKKFLNKIHINIYTIFLLSISILSGLIKEIIVITIILLIHEFGHFIFMYKYKWNIKKIEIYPFGGVAYLNEKIDKPLFEEFIITMMGPIFQEILFIFILLFYKINLLNKYYFDLFNSYNFFILIFNLLPIVPLDGSKILNIILNKIFNFRLSYLINIYISLLFLIIFFLIFKTDSSYYMIIIYLFFQIFNLYKNRYIFFNRFILEKKLNKSKYIKYKKVENLKKMYRNKNNLIKKDGIYITEYRYINKK